MIRFLFGRYTVSVVEMSDGTFNCYAATKASNGREIPLAIEPSQYAVVREYLRWCAEAVARYELTDGEAQGQAIPDIGLFLQAGRIWTAPGKRTDYPQPLSHFLQ